MAIVFGFENHTFLAKSDIGTLIIPRMGGGARKYS